MAEKDHTPLVVETPPQARAKASTPDGDLPPEVRILPLDKRRQHRAKARTAAPEPKRAQLPESLQRLRR